MYIKIIFKDFSHEFAEEKFPFRRSVTKLVSKRKNCLEFEAPSVLLLIFDFYYYNHSNLRVKNRRVDRPENN